MLTTEACPLLVHVMLVEPHRQRLTLNLPPHAAAQSIAPPALT
jgi:hypothetical protein